MKKIIWIGLAVSLIIGFFLSPFASSLPDGLEWVGEKLGFIHLGEGPQAIKSPLPDYALPGVKNEKIATSLAGLIGVLIVFGIGLLAGYLVKKKK